MQADHVFLRGRQNGVPRCEMQPLELPVDPGSFAMLKSGLTPECDTHVRPNPDAGSHCNRADLGSSFHDYSRCEEVGEQSDCKDSAAGRRCARRRRVPSVGSPVWAHVHLASGTGRRVGLGSNESRRHLRLVLPRTIASLIRGLDAIHAAHGAAECGSAGWSQRTLSAA